MSSSPVIRVCYSSTVTGPCGLCTPLETAGAEYYQFRAGLDPYGWRDIPTDCRFLLDYEIDEEESGARKKPWRYRWPDDVRDEVLARLLELNARCAAEEVRAGVGGGRGAGGADADGGLFG